MSENYPRSIWDGWEKQCYFRLYDSHGNHCATGWIDVAPRAVVGNCADTYRRVSAYIRAHYAVPNGYYHRGAHHARHVDSDDQVIVWANNILKLTPEQFREIDRLTQLETAMPQVEALVESAVGEEVEAVR